MKTTLLKTAVLLPLLTVTSLALTPVNDNFNSKTVNNVRWNLENFGAAKLAPGKKKLNFTVPKPSGDDYSILELKNNLPGYNESWEINLDVANLVKNGKAGAGIIISNADDSEDSLEIAFTGKGKRGGFTLIGITDGKDNPQKDLKANPQISSGTLRVSFDKLTKLLSVSYDKNGAKNGFKWTAVGSFSPAGKGGDRRGNWNMNPGGGRFGIILFGYSDGKPVKAGQASIDNFKLKAVR
ncbi:MAG: hypothetical protein EON58_10475 [Alphaproteobacteria bacterium]|nr:MAG: hypothetical protein EON58_10475 [Alphaproteobacteria bacterium]